MRLNPFKKDPAKKEAKQEKDAIFDEVKAQISREIGEIEKIIDCEERVVRYEALNTKLLGVYSDGKPTSVDTIAPAAGIGGIGGFLVGMATSAGIMVAFPVIGPGAFFGIWGMSAAIGVTGGAGVGSLLDGERRKLLRAKYGSVRNAQAIYKLQKTLTKNLEKDWEVVRVQKSKESEVNALRAHDAKLREQFNKSFKQAEAPVKAPVVKLVLQSSNKSRPSSP